MLDALSSTRFVTNRAILKFDWSNNASASLHTARATLRTDKLTLIYEAGLRQKYRGNPDGCRASFIFSLFTEEYVPLAMGSPHHKNNLYIWSHRPLQMVELLS